MLNITRPLGLTRSPVYLPGALLIPYLRAPYAWDVSAIDMDPPHWTGPFPTAPQSLLVESTPFDRKLNCESLMGFAEAKAVQCSGVYTGNATVGCQRINAFFYMTVHSPEVYAPNVDH